jgi:hypothetical protein
MFSIDMIFFVDFIQLRFHSKIRHKEKRFIWEYKPGAFSANSVLQLVISHSQPTQPKACAP